MKAKYTFTVNGIRTELELDNCSPVYDHEYIRTQIEEQYRLLKSINKDYPNPAKTEPKAEDDITKAVENLFVDSLKELAEEFNANKNKTKSSSFTQK